MSEQWKPCAPGYEVSNIGRVRSLERVVPCGPAPGTRVLPAQQIKPTLLNTGYTQVQLSGRKKQLVHRLVAAAFVEGDTSLVVNHKNGQRADNRAENLEWVTQSENNLHAFRVLGRAPTSLGKKGLAHPTAKPITVNGVTKSAADWAAERGWHVNVIYGRVRDGWPVERILSQPVRGAST